MNESGGLKYSSKYATSADIFELAVEECTKVLRKRPTNCHDYTTQYNFPWSTYNINAARSAKGYRENDINLGATLRTSFIELKPKLLYRSFE